MGDLNIWFPRIETNKSGWNNFILFTEFGLLIGSSRVINDISLDFNNLKISRDLVVNCSIKNIRNKKCIITYDKLRTLINYYFIDNYNLVNDNLVNKKTDLIYNYLFDNDIL